MSENKQSKNREWKFEEAHLKECRARIAANIEIYEKQLEERHKETKVLFDEVQSGNVELYDQMMTSKSLEEHSFNQLSKNQAAYEKPFLGGLITAISMKNYQNLFILVNMVYSGTRQKWR